jgi:hypothetical protein
VEGSPLMFRKLEQWRPFCRNVNAVIGNRDESDGNANGMNGNGNTITKKSQTPASKKTPKATSSDSPGAKLKKLFFTFLPPTSDASWEHGLSCLEGFGAGRTRKACSSEKDARGYAEFQGWGLRVDSVPNRSLAEIFDENKDLFNENTDSKSTRHEQNYDVNPNRKQDEQSKQHGQKQVSNSEQQSQLTERGNSEHKHDEHSLDEQLTEQQQQRNNAEQQKELHFGWLSFDVEGAELEVMSSIDWTKTSAEIITFEAPHEQNFREWKSQTEGTTTSNLTRANNVVITAVTGADGGVTGATESEKTGSGAGVEKTSENQISSITADLSDHLSNSNTITNSSDLHKYTEWQSYLAVRTLLSRLGFRNSYPWETGLQTIRKTNLVSRKTTGNDNSKINVNSKRKLLWGSDEAHFNPEGYFYTKQRRAVEALVGQKNQD